MSTILVTGATGSLGEEVINQLLEKTDASNIKALARDPEKAAPLKQKGVEVRKGDYDNYDSLVEAFKGVDKLYFVSGSDIANRSDQHLNVVKAAKAAGVKHVVYTSFQRKDESESSPLALVAEGHLIAEKALKESGLAYTFLQHNLYMDFIPMFAGEQVVEQGFIYLPAEEGKTAFVLRNDMARVGAAVLTTPGHENKVYEISAPEAYSFADIAKMIGEITGKEINYISPDPEEFIEKLKGFGVPEDIIGISVSFAKAIAQGELDKTSDIVEKLTGEKPGGIKEFLSSVYGK